MTNFLILICFLVLAFISYKISKDFLCPPCILSVSWALPFLFLVITESFKQNSYDISFISFYYVIGVIIFNIGYFIINNKYYKKIENIEFNENKKLTILFKLFIILEFLVVMYFLYDVNTFVKAHFEYNFWFTYKWNVSMGYYTDPVIIEYLRTASRIILCIMLVNLLNKNYDKKDTKWFILQAISTFALNFLGQGRGAVFSLLIPLFVIYFMMKRNSKKEIIKASIIGISLLIIVFVGYQILKNPYQNSSDNNIFVSIENYLCGGVVAFLNWFDSPHQYYYGDYTFRFLFALIKPLGFNVNVVSMVEPYVENINGNIGNVYTFYKWYANDFGIVYALFWQFIIGVIHGVITKKMYIKHNSTTLVVFALSIYPLVMQFFMDEYITMLSVWIQTFFWIILILKTNLFYTSLKEDDLIDYNKRNFKKSNKKFKTNN